MKFIRPLLILIFSTLAFTAGAQENISISGFVRNYTGLLTNEEKDWAILQNTINIVLEQKNEKVAFKVNPYLYHYFDNDFEFGLREAYIDLNFNNFNLRAGKQQIIWGKAEGVFITDIVSPKDLSEFLLRDFEEIRMGVTSLKAGYYYGNSTLEVVWVPVFTPTRMPEESSIWAPELPFPVTPTYDYSTSEVRKSLDNSELFIRFSSMGSKADFEIVGGYFWRDDPALHLTRIIDPVSMQLTGLTARPEYHRMMMTGMSFSMPFGPVIIRGEGSYNSGRYFQTEAQTAPDATIEKDYLYYMAGVDYTLAGIRLSMQYIQEYITNYETGILNDQFETTMTFLARKDFLRERLWLEFFAYAGITHRDALIRPRISYSLADGFDIQAGANIFTGTEGHFGQYNENDMIYMKLKYSF